MIKKIKIVQGSEDQRLDKYLKNYFLICLKVLLKKFKKKNILINGLSVKSKYLVNKNDLIIIKNYSEEIYAIMKLQSKKKNQQVLSRISKILLFLKMIIL